MQSLLFVSPLVNGVLGTIAFAIALSGRFLFGDGVGAGGYVFSVNGIISLVLLYTVLPSLFYRRLGHFYENAGQEKRSQIEKSFILWVILSAGVIGLHLAASEYAKFSSLGFLGLSILTLIRLAAFARRKENA